MDSFLYGLIAEGFPKGTNFKGIGQHDVCDVGGGGGRSADSTQRMQRVRYGAMWFSSWSSLAASQKS